MRSSQSAEELLPQVYAELRQLAAQRMANESGSLTGEHILYFHDRDGDEN
jgi:hypothetical protein